MNTLPKFNRSLKKEKTKNIINKNIIDINYRWDFNRCLKSVEVESEKFTNFFSGKRDTVFKFIYKEFNWLINNQEDVLDRFKMKPVYTTKLFKKLRTIAHETCCIKYGFFPYVARFSHKVNPSFQLFYMVKGNDVIFLIIDIYHLVLLADDYSYGEKIDKDAEKQFLLNSGKTYCLSNLRKNR